MYMLCVAQIHNIHVHAVCCTDTQHTCTCCVLHRYTTYMYMLSVVQTHNIHVHAVCCTDTQHTCTCCVLHRYTTYMYMLSVVQTHNIHVHVCIENEATRQRYINVHVSERCTVYIHVPVREMKEGRNKEASKAIQTTKQSNTQGGLFVKKNELPRVIQTHNTPHFRRNALPVVT